MRMHLPAVFLGAALILLAIGIRLVFFCVSVIHQPVTGDESLFWLHAKKILQGDCPLVVMSTPYQFPLESYLRAPVHHWLPRNAFGLRIIPFLLGLSQVVVSLLILRRIAPLRTVWPASLLVLFPSSYFLMIQSAYPPPGYAPMMLLHALVVLVAFAPAVLAGENVLLILLAGFLAGLLCSTHAMGLPLLVMVGLVVATSGGWRLIGRRFPLFSLGAVVGLLPLVIAKCDIGGAYTGVSHLRSVNEACNALWSHALTHALPLSLGFRSCLFPDKTDFTLLPGATPVLMGLWFVVLMSVWAGRVKHLAVSARRDGRWSLDLPDVFVGVSVLCLVGFAFFERTCPLSASYLLPVVWSFPFLVAFSCLAAGRILRRVIACAAVLLAVWNLAVSSHLMKAWAEEGISSRYANARDVHPAIDYLKQKGIAHCYASYSTAYRIDFETDEQVVCSQAYNERFSHWPLPYVADVDAATNVAFVLLPKGEDISGRFEAEKLEYDMAAFGITAESRTCGAYVVYTDFKRDRVPVHETVPSVSLKFSSSHASGRLYRLRDSDRQSMWHAGRMQETGMFVQVELPESMLVDRISLAYGWHPFDRAESLTVSCRTAGAWQPVPAQSRLLSPFVVFRNGHPAFREERGEVLRFNPVMTDGIRLAIDKPNPRRDWSIRELDIFCAVRAMEP